MTPMDVGVIRPGHPYVLTMPSSPLQRTRFSRLLLLFVLLCSGTLSSPPGYAGIADSTRELDSSKANLKKVDSSIRSLKNWLKKAGVEKNTQIKALRDSERAVAKINKHIYQLEIKLKETGEQIQSLTLTKEKQKAKLEEKKRSLAELVLATYKSGGQPAIKLLLNLEDPRSISRNMNYLRFFSDSQKEQINRYNAELEKIARTERTILEKKQQLASTKLSLQKQNKLQKAAIKKRETALAKLNKTIKNRQERLKAQVSNRQKLTSLIKQIEKTIAAANLTESTRPFATRKSRLDWPVRGKVTRSYKSRSAGTSLHSNGIFIRTPESRPVHAVHSGRVVFADWLRGFGLLIIIDHGSNYMSLYGQNHSLLKDMGEWVNPGDPIALTGNSGGVTETGLYFEIRKNGKPQNPVKWLKRQTGK
ncbi:MAG: hypothetical protein CSA52_01585 [Gammaproteobacteria bacterium]|nr:MAG: hypothetical protein CSB48_09475 [Pseudomonadota bacterium]PIE38663.1 MAG: hypothetical protein CSA52_01585 [Gammaproteobacteria bacterium]